MIAYIEKGKIIYKNDKFIITEKGGIGYRIYPVASILNNYKLEDEVSLWIYTAVRENSIDSYGLESSEEMEFFELLLNVSGIGPKSALGILNLASLETLQQAIANGDVGYLNKVSGIGKKTAEKIILELRDKLADYQKDGGFLSEENDIIEALKALGYSQNETREAVRKIPENIKGANSRIKEALKILNSRN